MIDYIAFTVETKLLITNITEAFCELETELEDLNKKMELENVNWLLIDNIKGMLLELNEDAIK